MNAKSSLYRSGTRGDELRLADYPANATYRLPAIVSRLDAETHEI